MFIHSLRNDIEVVDKINQLVWFKLGESSYSRELYEIVFSRLG